MSKLVRYNNGFVGTASDAVALILVQKGQAVVVTPKPAQAPESLLSKESIIAREVTE